MLVAIVKYTVKFVYRFEKLDYENRKAWRDLKLSKAHQDINVIQKF